MSAIVPEVTGQNFNDFMSKFDTVLFDCDGVLWHSTEVIPKAPDMITLLKKNGKRVFYITNNSTKTREGYLQKLLTLGFAAELDEIVCTAHVSAVYLKNRNFKDKVFVVGPKAVEEELTNHGIRYTTHSDDPKAAESFSEVGAMLKNDPEVKCVIVGADLNISYVKMSRACLYLYKNEDCLFLGTNSDPQFPLVDGRAIPGTGSLVTAVAYGSGREPVWIGKPEKPMYDFLHDNYHIDPSRTIMVGDRLQTDIKLAGNNNLLSLLVLTGMHGLDDVAKVKQSGNPDDQKMVPDFHMQSVTKWAEFMDNL